MGLMGLFINLGGEISTHDIYLLGLQDQEYKFFKKNLYYGNSQIYTQGK